LNAGEILLHFLGEPLAAEEARTTGKEVEVAENAAAGQAAGPSLERVEVSGEVGAADECADRRAADYVRLDADVLEGTTPPPSARPMSGLAMRSFRGATSVQ
jgi:hypothetical protein